MSPGDRRPSGDEESTADRQSSSQTDDERADDPPTRTNGSETPPTESPTGTRSTDDINQSSNHASADQPQQKGTDQSQHNGHAQSRHDRQIAETALPPRARSQTSESLWTRFRTAEDGPLLLFREFLISGSIVLVIGLLLFSLSGVWPPMVAVESGSMEPNIEKYDLIFVTEPGRFAPDAADTQGVVTAESIDDSEHESFNRAGSVVVYQNPNSYGPPIIHRAHFYVEEGENWHDQANPAYITADNCGQLQNCPAPSAGYITKGDNQASNSKYDQANGIAPVVEPSWITGIARLRLPYLGYIRLALTGAASFSPFLPAGVGAIGAGTAYTIGRRE